MTKVQRESDQAEGSDPVANAKRARRPNFLIFVTDQHRADHLGCYGNPIVRTPNIDAIAAGASASIAPTFRIRSVCPTAAQ